MATVDVKPAGKLGTQERSLRKRVGGEVETVGVSPVPEKQRTMTPGKMFIVWLMASASATTPLIGLLLFHYGLAFMIAAIVVAFLIGVIPAGLFSEMGRQVPLTALVVARKTFGWDGSLVFSALFTVVNLGWFGLNTEIGASILASITHSSTYLWDVIVGGAEIILVLFGMKWLERFYRYTSVILIASYLALTVYLVTHYTLHAPKQTVPMNWGTALTVVLTFSLLAWTYKLSTFVMLVDWIYVQRRRTPADAFFEHPHSRAGRIVPSAIGAVIIGFVISYWGNHFLPGFFYNTLPLPVVGGIIAAALYGKAATLWPHASATAIAPLPLVPTA
jgi:purine-cytosine permease-like protein